MGDVIPIRPWPLNGSWAGGQPASVEGEPRVATDVRLEFLAFEPALRRRALRLARVRDAEDLVRDTFDGLLRSEDDGQREGGLAVWLFALLGRLVVERSQRRPRLVREQPAVPPVTPPRWARTTPARFSAAVAMLPPDFRSVFLLHALHGWSYDEIAVELQLEPMAVFARLYRARLLLKDLLADLLEGEGHRRDGGV